MVYISANLFFFNFQIEDIDANDHANPQLLSEYVNDIYAYLFKLENFFSIRQNFLDSQVDVSLIIHMKRE